jgi:hypothetical protein
MLSSFSFLFPIPTIVSIIGLITTYYGIVLLFEISLWLINLVRGR